MRKHLTFSNVVALACLFVVLGGTSAAQDAITSAKKLITGKQIKDGTVKGKDIRDASLTAKDFKGGLPAGADGERGPTGPTGPAGSADTAAQVLEKLLTVDGPASGLSADTVDGVNSDALARTDDPRLTDARAPSGPAAGDLAGTYPNPTIGTGVVDEANLNTFTQRVVSSTTDVEVASFFFRFLSGATTVRIAVTANGLAAGGAGAVTIVDAAGTTVFSCPVTAAGVRGRTCVSPALPVAENSGNPTGAYRVLANATAADAPLIIRDVSTTFN